MLTPAQESECKKLKELFIQKSPLSQKAFALKYGFGTPGNLWQYLNGRRPLNVNFAAKMAKLLGVNIAEFSTRLAAEAEALGIPQGIDLNISVAPSRQNKKIPILSYVQAGGLTGQGQVSDKLKAIDVGDYITGDDDLSDDVFAMIVRGRSMTPDFEEGDTVLFDPSISPQPGDFVVAAKADCHVDDPEATFKKYRPRGYDENGHEIFELVPLNEDFPTIYSDKTPCTIIGVLIEHRRRYRRR